MEFASRYRTNEWQVKDFDIELIIVVLRQADDRIR